MPKLPFKINVSLNIRNVVILTVLYIVLRDLDIDIPYLNLLNDNAEARIVVVFLVAVLLYRPTGLVLVYWGIGLTLIYGILLVVFGSSSFGVFGLALYAILVLVMVDFIKRIR